MNLKENVNWIRVFLSQFLAIKTCVPQVGRVFIDN